MIYFHNYIKNLFLILVFSFIRIFSFMCCCYVYVFDEFGMSFCIKVLISAKKIKKALEFKQTSVINATELGLD